MIAEVIGNLLAKEFDLKSPAPAIINFSPEFRMKLNSECEEVLSIVDERPKLLEKVETNKQLISFEEIENYAENAIKYL